MTMMNTMSVLLTRPRARRGKAAQRPTCCCSPVLNPSAASVLCANIIASSFGCGGLMPVLQQVHQLAMLSLLRVIRLVNSLSMASRLRAHCTSIMFTTTGLRCQTSKHVSGEYQLQTSINRPW